MASKPSATKPRKAATKSKPKAAGKPKRAAKAKAVKLLSGGNPQIAKADGDAPVRAFIAASPGWKRAKAAKIDAIIARNVPNVQRAVRWNSPMYSLKGGGWFVSFHLLTKYIKVTFFEGAHLRPVPPGGTEKSKEARWIDIYEDDKIDETQLGAWFKQASKLPGWAGN